MSELRCACGHVICDEAERLPYKGAVMPDVHHESFYGWALKETLAYVAAVRGGRAETWLNERGYPDCYGSAAVSEGVVLHEHLQGQYSMLARRVFECVACGRIHVESEVDHQFISYMPDSGAAHQVLARSQHMH